MKSVLPRLVALLTSFVIVACGGNGGDSTAGAPSSAPKAQEPNVASIVVDGGPKGSGLTGANTPYVTVTICAPGDASRCQSIDHVIVDTGSTGLRIRASALKIPLPSVGRDGAQIAECMIFGSGAMWGSVRKADVKISGELAAGISVHIFGDETVNAMRSCIGDHPDMNDPSVLAGNGVLGISSEISDCDATMDYCGSAAVSFYQECVGTSCTPAGISRDRLVSNPVAFFDKNNNGTIIELPEIAPDGETTVKGKLVFGIGTQANNRLGSAVPLASTPDGGLPMAYNGKTYTAYVDSGSSGYALPEVSSISHCSTDTSNKSLFSGLETYYCPPQATYFHVQLSGQGQPQATTSLSLKILDAAKFSKNRPDARAFDGLALPNTEIDESMVLVGLPFFYGRAVYTAIAGRDAEGTPGPYIALKASLSP